MISSIHYQKQQLIQNLNYISTHHLYDKVTIVTDKDNFHSNTNVSSVQNNVANPTNNPHSYDTATLENNKNKVTAQHSQEITYDMAYHLLLSLVNNNVKLLEEVLSIAKILVEEGVIVAQESKIKKNVATKILYNINRNKTKKDMGYSMQ